MGIRDWFAKRPTVLSEVRFPCLEYPTAASAITAVVDANERAGDESACVTFEASNAGNAAVIEIAGDQINLGKREIALDSVLQNAGKRDIANRVRPGGRKQSDRTCWILSDPNAQDLAVIVDTLFSTAFGLGDPYQFVGRRSN